MRYRECEAAKRFKICRLVVVLSLILCSDGDLLRQFLPFLVHRGARLSWWLQAVWQRKWLASWTFSLCSRKYMGNIITILLCKALKSCPPSLHQAIPTCLQKLTLKSYVYWGADFLPLPPSLYKKILSRQLPAMVEKKETLNKLQYYELTRFEMLTCACHLPTVSVVKATGEDWSKQWLGNGRCLRTVPRWRVPYSLLLSLSWLQSGEFWPRHCKLSCGHSGAWMEMKR
jgi:hypothetical protein